MRRRPNKIDPNRLGQGVSRTYRRILREKGWAQAARGRADCGGSLRSGRQDEIGPMIAGPGFAARITGSRRLASAFPPAALARDASKALGSQPTIAICSRPGLI